MALPDIEDVIREMHGDVKVLLSRVRRIESHQEQTNGSVRDLRENALRQEGALAVLKWLVGVTLTVMSVGVGIAGLVLLAVARGGP